ncbi:MAG: hypothetical protein L6R39_000009 [Caloplaca ligustica]|nr:MAG: hypothetical protein L6R39_000009 [Caloplaca ligustica]
MASPPIHLILDWDGTLTASSTLPLIAQIGYDRNLSSSLPSWNTISEAYMSDYREHAANYIPTAADRKTVVQELAWLESWRDVERKSMERAENAGIFKGVEGKDVQRAAEQAIRDGKVVLREGSVRMVKRILQDGGKVGVVSVGWSGEFIKACLKTAMGEMKDGRGARVEDIDVRANEIVGGKDGRMSRYFEERGRNGEGGLWSAGDKRKVTDGLVAAERDCVKVYIGDSTTDLGCLLAADVGICIRTLEGKSDEQTQLEQSLERLGIHCFRLDTMQRDELLIMIRRGGSVGGSSLWWASDFDEICGSPLVDLPRSARKFGPYSWVAFTICPHLKTLLFVRPTSVCLSVLANPSNVIRNAKCRKRGYKIGGSEVKLKQI